MIFGLFKKKDPICGMKQQPGRGFVDESTGHWFCNLSCKKEFKKRVKEHGKMRSGGSCCH